MTRKLYFCLIIILGLVLIAGCGGGGNPPPPDNHPEIVQFLAKFENAVEVYTVSGPTGMLDCLSNPGFTLTITEAGLTYNKSYGTLESELEDDETNQTTWRLPDTETGGHGYVLDLVLGPASYSNETATGAIVTHSFEVYESATSPSIPRTKTDNGVITWQLAKISGAWKAVAMTIEYQTFSGLGFKEGDTGNRSSGFGFTTLF